MRKPRGSWRIAIAACVLVALPCAAESTAEMLGRADALLRSGSWNASVPVYRAALEQDKASQAAHAGLVRALWKSGDVAGSEAAAAAAQTALPKSGAVLTAIAELQFREGNFTESETLVHKAIDAEPKQARAWWLMGRLFEVSSSAASAAAMFGRAYNLDASDPDILLSWAESRVKESDEIPALERLLEVAPNESKEKLAEARAHIAMHKQLGDQDAWVLASPYQKTIVAMFALFDGPRRYAGWGVKVSVNGGPAANYLLDTGASGLVMKPRAVRNLRLRTLGELLISGFGDEGSAKAELALADSVQIGGVEFRKCPVVVAESRRVGDQIDGIVGADVFGEFLVTLDFAKPKIVLEPFIEGQPPRHELHDREFPVYETAFTPVYRLGHLLAIPTVVNGGKASLFVMDSGADRLLISLNAARQAGKVGEFGGMTFAGASGKVKKVYDTDTVTLQFARFRQQNRGMFSLDMDTMSKDLGVEIGGFLGRPVLNMFSMTIDYRNSLVNLVYHREVAEGLRPY